MLELTERRMDEGTWMEEGQLRFSSELVGVGSSSSLVIVPETFGYATLNYEMCPFDEHRVNEALPLSLRILILSNSLLFILKYQC